VRCTGKEARSGFSCPALLAAHHQVDVNAPTELVLDTAVTASLEEADAYAHFVVRADTAQINVGQYLVSPAARSKPTHSLPSLPHREERPRSSSTDLLGTAHTRAGALLFSCLASGWLAAASAMGCVAPSQCSDSSGSMRLVVLLHRPLLSPGSPRPLQTVDVFNVQGGDVTVYLENRFDSALAGRTCDGCSYQSVLEKACPQAGAGAGAAADCVLTLPPCALEDARELGASVVHISVHADRFISPGRVPIAFTITAALAV